METQKNQPEATPSSAAPTPAVTSCRKKKHEEATFLEDIKDHIDEFIHASMDEHKTCFKKTIQKMFGMSKIVAQRNAESKEVESATVEVELFNFAIAVDCFPDKNNSNISNWLLDHWECHVRLVFCVAYYRVGGGTILKKNHPLTLSSLLNSGVADWNGLPRAPAVVVLLETLAVILGAFSTIIDRHWGRV
ncbi:hypothetical protein Dimus_025519 [Dionaea muscipula]